VTQHAHEPPSETTAPPRRPGRVSARTPTHLVADLQRTAGNAAVSRAITAGSLVVQRISAKNTERKKWIEHALSVSAWDDADTPGAYYIFNGLSKDDMVAVYNALAPANRKKLEDNLAQTALDRPRMYQGIQQAKSGGTWWRDKSESVHAAIRSGDLATYPSGAYWIINPLNANDITKMMTFLDRDHLDELIANRRTALDAGVPNAERIASAAAQARGGRGPTKREQSIADLIPGSVPVPGVGDGKVEVPTIHGDCTAAFKALAALGDADLLRTIRSLPQEKRFTLQMNLSQVDGLGIDGDRMRHFVQRADESAAGLRADRILDCAWQPDHLRPAGGYSKLIQAHAPGNVGNTFDVSIDEIGDGESPPEEVAKLWSAAAPGRGGMLWPPTLNKSTVPNLWSCKQWIRQEISDLQAMDLMFVIQCFQAIEFVLHLGPGITATPAVSTRPRGGRGGMPPRKGPGGGGGTPGGGGPGELPPGYTGPERQLGMGSGPRPRTGPVVGSGEEPIPLESGLTPPSRQLPAGAGPGGVNWGTGRKVLNLGGEGERADAIDFNDMGALLKKDGVAKPGSTLVGDYMSDWPLPADFLDEVCGNRMVNAFGARLNKVAQESYRTLKPGGTLSVWTTSKGSAQNWKPVFEAAGFKDVKITHGGSGIEAVK
jgi:hypothetical protein